MTEKQRMKIAFFLATSGHSGVDRAMQNLLPLLADRGYDIDLIRVGNHGPRLTDLSQGISVMETTSSHVYSSFFFLCSYLKKYQPHVLFSDKDRVNRTALLAQRWTRTRTRVVVSLGTTVSVNLKDRLWFERTSQKYSIKYLYPRAHRFIVTSKGVADDVQSFTGRTFENIAIVPRPVISEELYERHFPLPDHTWFRQKEKPVILGVGELSSRKDFSTLLKAFSRIHSQRECRLMILGQGKQRFLLLQLAQNLGLENDFCLPGYVPDPYRYMRHADCFVLSSRWEGLGFVLIEALAVGTPVVSTRCPSGPEEILHNGMYGKLVPVGDDKTMAEAIGQTLQSPLPRTFLQKASFPYTLGRSADAYLQAMRD